MNSKKCILLLSILLVGFLSSCNTKKKVLTTKEVDLSNPYTELFALMQGSFDSSEQAEKEANYYDITLHMYPIWKDKKDAKYLYVEQSVTSKQDKPYRQRVYKLVDNNDGTIASYVYSIKDDSLYIGKWNEPSFFDSKNIDILDIRKGCEVILTKQSDGTFSGSTGAESCGSSLRGASYATSKVFVAEGVITSWDQGFDNSGKQVWGAEDGPYIFKKTNN